jgi:hypothetical protein
MKKNYLSPNIEVVELELNYLMSGSVGSTSEEQAASGSEESTVNFAPGMESGSDDLDW